MGCSEGSETSSEAGSLPVQDGDAVGCGCLGAGTAPRNRSIRRNGNWRRLRSSGHESLAARNGCPGGYPGRLRPQETTAPRRGLHPDHPVSPRSVHGTSQRGLVRAHRWRSVALQS